MQVASQQYTPISRNLITVYDWKADSSLETLSIHLEVMFSEEISFCSHCPQISGVLTTIEEIVVGWEIDTSIIILLLCFVIHDTNYNFSFIYIFDYLVLNLVQKTLCSRSSKEFTNWHNWPNYFSDKKNQQQTFFAWGRCCL